MHSQNGSWQAVGENQASYGSMSSMLISLATSLPNCVFVLLLPMQMLEGIYTMLSSANNALEAKKETYAAWNKCEDIGDFTTGLALFSTGVYATIKIIEASITDNPLAPYSDAISIVAIAQAIKSGYNFTKATADLLSSQETGKKLNEQRREVLFHGLKLVGYTLISCGFFPAGAAFLGAALAVSLYDHSPQVQKYCSAITNFFVPRSLLPATGNGVEKQFVDHALSHRA